MTEHGRSIELEIEVAGTPEEVWAAIATGPGITSWYVPHRIEEREGGDAWASFGPGMDVTGRVTVWDPPRHFGYAGTDDGPGLAFEWFVEAKGEGSCIVRLVNSGFGTGTEWDDHYDAMVRGWGMFLQNLELHCEHFRGQAGSASLPLAMWDESPTDAWARAAETFGFTPAPQPGDPIQLSAPDAPTVNGTVHDVDSARITFLTSEPATGHGFIAAESQGAASVSLWLYLYGDDAPAIAQSHQDAWMAALAAAGPAS